MMTSWHAERPDFMRALIGSSLKRCSCNDLPESEEIHPSFCRFLHGALY